MSSGITPCAVIRRLKDLCAVIALLKDEVDVTTLGSKRGGLFDGTTARRPDRGSVPACHTEVSAGGEPAALVMNWRFRKRRTAGETRLCWQF